MATKKAAAAAGPEVPAELAVVASVERMEVRPGDVIVVKADQVIRPEFALYLRKRIRRYFPENDVIVIDGGIDLQVLAEGPGVSNE